MLGGEGSKTRPSRSAGIHLSTKTLITLALAALFGLALAVSPAQAQTELKAGDGADATAVPFSLVSQTPYVASDGSLTLKFDDTLNSPGLTIGVNVYQPLETAEAVDQPITTIPRNRLPPVSLNQLALDDAGLRVLEIPVRDGQPFDEQDRLFLADPGVYPIVIEVRGNEGLVASVRTHLIRLPTDKTEPGSKLPLAVVFGVGGDDGLNVPAAIKILNDYPDVPLTVHLEDEVFEVLENSPSLREQFAAAVAERPVISQQSVDVDPSALGQVDQTSLFQLGVKADRDKIKGLGLTPAAETLLSSTVPTPDGLATLKSAGIKTLFGYEGETASGISEVGSVHLIPSMEKTSTANPVSDRQVEVQNLISRLVLNGRNTTDPIALGPGILDTADSVSYAGLLAALTEPGPVKPLLLSEISSRATAEPLEPAEQATQNLLPISSEIARVQTRLATYDSFFDGGGTSPTDFRFRLLQALELGRSPSERSSAVSNLNTELISELRVVDLPQDQSFALASRTAPLPLTIKNRSGGRRMVMLQFRSDKIEVAENERVVPIEPGSSTLTLNIESRSLGVSPLDVIVLTPDAKTRLATTRFRVSSTAVPGLGLVLTGGALSFLIGWWFLSIFRNHQLSKNDNPAQGDDENE